MAAEKKADVWMPLWIGAYLADTMKLTTIQHGAYLLLLIAYWRERKPLADKDDELRSITKMERAEWKRNRPVLSAFFKVADGFWWHKRVEQEIAAADARSKKASEKAEKAAQARWKQPNGDAPSIHQALHEDMLDECPTPSPIPNPSDSSEANASAADAATGAVDKPRTKSPEDMAKSQLWRTAVSVLADGGCANEDQARSFMGKLVGDYGFEISRDAVAAAVTSQPADAREYLKATCMRLKGERGADHGKPLTVLSDATEQTQAYLASRKTTPEQDAAAEAARIEFLAKHKRPPAAGAQA